MLRKYARLEVLEAWSGQRDQGLRKSAHRVAFDYEPRPGFIYVRSRMISSRTNDNHDTFPDIEIEKGYQTFLGKPVFVNHHNANHRRARGVIVAVALHRDRNPDSSPDTWAEGLMEIDALRFPRLAAALLAGRVNRTSMGVDVEWSKCSACGNKATNPAEYCAHLPALKGKKIRKTNPVTGRVEEKLIHEICAGLSFFENSLLVEDPADPTAYVLGDVDARGLKMPGRGASARRKAASLRSTASAEFSQSAADADNLYHLTGCHHVSCGRTLQHRHTAAASLDIDDNRLNRRGDPAVHPVRSMVEGARAYSSRHGLEDPHAEGYGHIETNPDRIRKLAQAYHSLPMNDPGAHAAFADMARQVHDQYHHLTHAMRVKVQSVDHDPYANHLEMAHDLNKNGRLQVLSTAATGPHGFFDDDTNDKFRAVHDAFGHAATGRSFDRHGEEAAWLAHSRMFHGPARHAMTTETRGQNSMLIATGQFAPQKTALLPHELMHRDAALRQHPPGPGAFAYAPELEDQGEWARTAAAEGEDAPAARPSRKKQGGDHPFFRDHPMNAGNIVTAYHQTTDDERSLGRRWYSDAHHVAGAIAGGNHALGAGLLSAYSPQTAWPINMFNASRAAQGEPPGPGSGAMGSQQKPAIQMLAGKHHSEVLKGPKTRAFAKLIEHGDDTPEDKASGNHQVVVDRHALSVAAGRRLSKEEGGKFPASQQQHYDHVSHMYRDAARTLSEHYGREVKPHEVQAATWLRQQRMNQAEDSAGLGGGGAGASKGRVQTFTRGQERWKQHHQQQHPGGIPEENMHYHGRRSVAYGEERVPPQVDTLRMEECPVCGEHDVWSGDRCPVCGFTVPPSLFRDPDTGRAQQVRDQLDQSGEVMTGPDQAMGSDPDAAGQLQHPDQLTPDGVPVGQGGPGQPAAQVPGQEEQAAGEEEQEQGAEDAEAAREEQGEGQELENEGTEDQLAPAPAGQLACPACGQTFAPDVAAQPGVPCPACRQGSLEPAGGPQKEQDDDPERDDDMAGSKTASALAQAQARRIAELTAENDVLREQMGFLANAAGAGQHLAAIRTRVMQRHADVLNPASPVPDPPEAPPTQTTEETLAPETMDDPSRPGTTPGSTTHVPAEQTTTAITPGVEMQTPPATDLIDVTAPVQGTNPSQDGGVPLSQRRIETDVRIDPDPLKAHGPGIGGQGDNGAAFPWLLESGQGPGQRAASKITPRDASAARTFGSIRLARLRVQAGLAQGDELAVAAAIERDASMSGPMIEHEIGVLSRVRPAQPAARPMARQGATRSAPSLASVGAAHYASAASAASAGADDSDLFID